jgi:hypothetical protein
MTPEQREKLKRAAWIGLWLIVANLGGVIVGRFLAPAQVETREVERLVYRDLTVEDLTRGMTFAREVHVTRWRNVTTTITVTPDAGTTTTITDRTVEREGTAESSSSTETRRTTEDHAGQRDTERVSKPALTSGSLGALVGATWTELAPAPSVVTFGVLGDLRLGRTPCFVGGWGALGLGGGQLRQGTLGLSGRCELP